MKHELTAEDRRKGAARTAEVMRERRQDARRMAAQYLADLTGQSLQKLEQLLDDPNAAIQFRAAREVLDRVLGRSGQPLEPPIDPDEVETQDRRGVNLHDVLRVAIDAGITPSESVPSDGPAR
jgi:hypothetical protein